jgi:hypothetical protein
MNRRELLKDASLATAVSLVVFGEAQAQAQAQDAIVRVLVTYHSVTGNTEKMALSGGGAFGASATTGPDSSGIDEKELAAARELGKRVTEVATVVKRGSA